MEHRLSERKKKILEALVDSYINTAEPISSGNIKNNYLPEVSSATIRSELATLEELGYLYQPHVSAGRVPSSKAYRFYVDSLDVKSVGKNEIEQLKRHFDVRLKEMEDIVRDTAKYISDSTNYTSVAVLSEPDDVVVKEIKLIDLGDDTALVIVITDGGVLKDKIISLPKGLTDDYFVSAARMLNDIFAGKAIKQVDNFDALVDDKLGEYRQIFDEVCRMLQNAGKKGEKVFLEGANKIFDYPEYDDVDNVKQFLSVIESKEKINSLVAGDDIEFSIKIGRDDSEELNHMALVTAKYMINGREANFGVIGPERMDYKRVIKVLHNIVETTQTVIEGAEENIADDRGKE